MSNELNDEIERNVRAALAEDVGGGDWTAQLLPEGQTATATIVCRVPAVICGQRWAENTMLALDRGMRIEWLVPEGASVAGGETICRMHGRTRALLTGERTALNFLQMLSAVATATWRYVEAVRGTRAKILDTRKTLPGLRLAEKYAVTVGGGMNHRKGLYDGILIKENHIAAAGSVSAALKRAQGLAPAGVWIQIEVETRAQLEEALSAGAKMVLLDNMTPAQMAEAVKLAAGRAELEASGGITLDTVREIAETGVDRISIGSLTKDIDAIDLSMRLASK